jgi:hypothetical protein
MGRLLIVLAGLLALVLVAGVMGQGAWRSAYVALATSVKSGMQPGAPQGALAFTPATAEFVWQKLVSDLGRACLLGLLAVGVAWFARRGKIPAPLASAGVLLLILIELWPVSARVMGTFVGDVTERNLEAGRDDVVDFLERQGPPGTFRILPDPREFQSNRFAGFGIASLGGMHAAKPRLVQDLFDRRLKENLGWLRLLNVAYIVQYGALPEPSPYLAVVYKRGVALPGAHPAGEDSAYASVTANLVALPRATLVGRYAVVQPAEAILDSVRLATREMGDFTYLEQDPHLRLGPVAGGRVRIASYRLNDVTIDVETPGPALLRLADQWYPDWTARVDGRPTPVLKADYLLRAVQVPAGRHQVVFRFESPAVRRGLLVSLISLVVVLAGFAASGWRRWRGPAAGGQAQRPVTGEEAA